MNGEREPLITLSQLIELERECGLTNCGEGTGWPQIVTRLQRIVDWAEENK